MARGFLSGVVMGGLVSVFGAGVASVMTEPPAAPRASSQSPQAAEAPVPGEGAEAAAVTDADLVLDGVAPPTESPDADDVSAAEAAGSDTALVPETGSAEDLGNPAATPGTSAVVVESEAPVLPSPQAALAAAPDTEGQLSISTDPAQPPAPEVPDTETAFAPQEDTSPELPSAEAPSPNTDVSVAPDAPEIAEAPAAPQPPAAPPQEEGPPETATEGGTDAPAETATEGGTDAPAETAEAQIETAAVPEAEPDEDRPSIGRPATSLVDQTPEVPVASPEPEAAPSGPPIEVFAIPFDNPDDKPLMSIVLMDTGVDLSGGPVGLAALKTFPYPLTFAVDAQLPDAAARAADYRAQGFEVAALLDLPAGATASDTEINLGAALAAVPEAVALMEGVGTGVQETREVSDQVTAFAQDSGHGLVLQSKGLNTAQKLALRDGVPAGLIFRDFDSAGQTPTVIRRFLDQAAFRAGQEGGVIMVGRLRPDTISALLLWGLQDRAQRVALAPVSAVLLGLETGQ